MASYTDLLGGGFGNWNFSSRQPVFVTYSFGGSSEYVSRGLLSSEGAASQRAFTESQKQLIRDALQQWDAVSGIHFLEVADQAGDIRFSQYNTSIDFGSAIAYTTAAGRSYNLNLLATDKTRDDPYDGDIILDYSLVTTRVVLHEIGHAIGLKHPSDNPTAAETVMGYSDVGFTGGLGTLDQQAAAYLYGAAGSDGYGQPWTWDAANYILTMSGSGTIVGTSARDIITGSNGNDIIFGLRGNDILRGNAGDDLLLGGPGDDVLISGTGNDRLYGESGFDTADYSAYQTGMEIRLNIYVASQYNYQTNSFDPAYYRSEVWKAKVLVQNVWQITQSDKLDSIEAVIGTSGNDIFHTGARRETMQGGPGNDWYYFYSQENSPSNPEYDPVYNLDNVNTVVFGRGDDRDVIDRWNGRLDKIDLRGIPEIRSVNDLLSYWKANPDGENGYYGFEFGNGDSITFASPYSWSVDLLNAPFSDSVAFAKVSGGPAYFRPYNFIFSTAPIPTFSISAASADKNEGLSGNTPFTFTVIRTGDTSVTSTVNWSVSGGNSPAANAADFVGGAFPTGQVILSPGETSRTITINVQGDSIDEANESFVVTLGSPTGGTIDPAHGSATGIIRNDDALTAADVFAGRKLEFLAKLANAAYHLDTTSVPILGAHELVLVGYNELSSSGDALYDALGSKLRWLTTNDLPALAPSLSSDPHYPVTGLYNGLYTNKNGAVLIGRTADALFISFRGTNDNSAGYGPKASAAGLATPDVNDWSKPLTAPLSRHYDLFTDFVSAIRSYANNDGNGIKNIYVTGHSLGGAMGEAFALNAAPLFDADLSFETMLFATPGYLIGANQPHPGVTNLWVDQDPIIEAGSGPYGFLSLAGDRNTIYHPAYGTRTDTAYHDMELYVAYAKFLADNKIDISQLQSYGGVNYDRIIANPDRFIHTDTTRDFQIGGSNDILEGTSFNEMILGGGGTDILRGLSGTDLLIGGAGADWFVFESFALSDARGVVPVFDRVVDYSFAAGDKLDLSDILSTAFNHGSGQPAAALVRAIASGSGANLQIDPDGAANGAHWMTIARLDGIRGGNSLNVVLDSSLPAGTTISVLPAVALNNFNGDAYSDILWLTSGGFVGVWQMNGSAIASAPGIAPAPAGGHIAGVGDLNGDGTTDIVWSTDGGFVGAWLMNGSTILASPGIAPAPAGGHIAAVADLSGDGMADILWQTDTGFVGVWTMNGSQVLAKPGIAPGPAGGHIAGTGDFNGDGMSDILWRTDTGFVGVWLMNGNQISSTPGIAQGPAGGHIAGTGDFNGDGMVDILWQTDGGFMGVWLMNGSQILSAPGIAPAPGGGHVAEIADLNGDGMSDIVWHTDSGFVGVWEMNGSAIIATPGIAPGPIGGHISPDYHLV